MDALRTDTLKRTAVRRQLVVAAVLLLALAPTTMLSAPAVAAATSKSGVASPMAAKGVPDVQLQALTPKLDSLDRLKQDNLKKAHSSQVQGKNQSGKAQSGENSFDETAMMEKGMKLSADRQWDEAASVFKEVLGKDPGNVNAYYNLGAVSENKGDYESALNFYKAAQGLSPRDSEINEAVTAMTAKLHGAAGGGMLADQPGAASSSSGFSNGRKGHKRRQSAASEATNAPVGQTASIPGAPAGYVPTPSYYGTKSPPASITAGDPNFEAYRQQAGRARRQQVQGQMMRCAARMGFMALRMGLRFR